MSKRSSDATEAVEAPMAVKIKLEAQSSEYSEDVRKKLNTASRTSTACDRCRVRKMRCDDRPEGCVPCRQNQTECKTTDRITGKATVRGYADSLEKRIEDLEERNRRLVKQLEAVGHRPAQECEEVSKNTTTSPNTNWSGGRECRFNLNIRESEDGRPQLGAVRKEPPAQSSLAAQRSTDSGTGLPKFRTGLTGNNYLGVSTGNSLLSSIRGTSMNVLGMEIDIADYTSPDLDEPDSAGTNAQPVYNKSYRAFIQTAFGSSPKLSKVELPPRHEAMEQVAIFFRGLNPFMPILHAPTFMEMFTRVYDDPTFQPSVAETVMIHAVFAILHVQISIRHTPDETKKAELNQSSNFHYHYALSFFPQLMASHTLADVQALALLCVHVRAFPKPGPCWMLLSITLNLAIELGLHRSAKTWATTSKRPDALENEIRKRVFWGLVLLQVTVSGNLGRPLALRSEDWDVEMPEAIDDELLTSQGIDRSKPNKSNFVVGIECMRCMPIMTDLYTNIYTVKRSPETYVETVRHLEHRIDKWVAHWPSEVQEQTADESSLNHVHALWLHIVPLHMRLLLRHPSLSLTSDADFNAENLQVCLVTCRNMLSIVKQLQKFHCLDATWQSGALYVLAISTTLFANWERRESTTRAGLTELRDEMSSWLSIIGEIGVLLGSGRKLQDAVRLTIEKTLRVLTKFLPTQTQTSSEAHKPDNSSESRPSRHPVQLKNNPSNKSDANGYGMQTSYYPPYSDRGEARSNPVDSSRSSTGEHTNAYPAPPPDVDRDSTNMGFAQPQSFPYPTQYSQGQNNYQDRPYAQVNAMSTDPGPAPSSYMNTYSQPQGPYNVAAEYDGGDNSQFAQPVAGGPLSWRDFTGNVTSDLGTGTADYIDPASALMQLGRGPEASGGPGGTPQQQQPPPPPDLPVHIDLQHVNQMNGRQAQPWPFYQGL